MGSSNIESKVNGNLNSIGGVLENLEGLIAFLNNRGEKSRSTFFDFFSGLLDSELVLLSESIDDFSCGEDIKKELRRVLTKGSVYLRKSNTFPTFQIPIIVGDELLFTQSFKGEIIGNTTERISGSLIELLEVANRVRLTSTESGMMSSLTSERFSRESKFFLDFSRTFYDGVLSWDGIMVDERSDTKIRHSSYRGRSEILRFLYAQDRDGEKLSQARDDLEQAHGIELNNPFLLASMDVRDFCSSRRFLCENYLTLGDEGSLAKGLELSLRTIADIEEHFNEPILHQSEFQIYRNDFRIKLGQYDEAIRESKDLIGYKDKKVDPRVISLFPDAVFSKLVAIYERDNVLRVSEEFESAMNYCFEFLSQAYSFYQNDIRGETKAFELQIYGGFIEGVLFKLARSCHRLGISGENFFSLIPKTESGEKYGRNPMLFNGHLTKSKFPYSNS